MLVIDISIGGTMNLFKDYVSDIKSEFSGYNGKRFSKDLMAGVTVAAVALPLALAFGVSSGATAAAGLVTAIIGGIIISIFSGASFQISGPTGAMTAILVTLAAKYGMQGILIACFVAGIILMLVIYFYLRVYIGLRIICIKIQLIFCKLRISDCPAVKIRHQFSVFISGIISVIRLFQIMFSTVCIIISIRILPRNFIVRFAIITLCLLVSFLFLRF